VFLKIKVTDKTLDNTHVSKSQGHIINLYLSRKKQTVQSSDPFSVTKRKSNQQEGTEYLKHYSLRQRRDIVCSYLNHILVAFYV